MAKKPIQNQNYQASVDTYFRALREVQAARKAAPRSAATKARPEKIDINQEIAREQKIRNDNAEQDITLKRKTLDRLFKLLTLETVLIFLLAVAQGASWPAGFHIDEPSFRILAAATIAQITGMLFVAVRYLFPKK